MTDIQPAGAGLDARITGVTVFTDGARVTRSGMTSVRPGLHPVVVATLPELADPSSVRVAARGNDLALLNVEVRHQVGTEPLQESVAELRADVRRCQDAVRELDDADAAEQAGLAYLGHLSEASATALARALGAGRVGYDELSGMASHLSAATAGTLARRREIGARRLAAQRELDAAEERLNAAESGAGRPLRSVAVSVLLEAEAWTEAEIELTYHVKLASWRPQYDLVLDGDRLKVSYLAEITQRTGEDWPETALVLSTARQGLRRGLPELSPWYIGRPQPPAPAPASRPRPRGAEPPAGGGPERARVFAASAPLPEAKVLAAQPGESDSGGVTYTVARPLAVPGDGDPHKTLIASLDLDVALDYLTVPVLAAEAYLRATVSNGSLLLLPGQARVFHGAQFSGETKLDSVAPGEEFKVQLGVDDQIKVERTLRRRTTGKAVIGGTRTIDVGYEITVTNHRDRKAVVSVKDRIPVSTDGDIKVKPREASPAPVAADDLGELTWALTLGPGESAAVRHRFTVEHPSQVTVAGL
ncbi:MAG TPA: mucoidy inhibitor MuiA family protein [Trebonia sp.]